MKNLILTLQNSKTFSICLIMCRSCIVLQVVALHPQFTRSNYKQFVTGGNKVGLRTTFSLCSHYVQFLPFPATIIHPDCVRGQNRILQTFSLWLGWRRRCTGLCLVWKALSFLSLWWSALGRAAHFHKVLFAQQCLKGNASQARQVDVIIKRVHSLRISGRILCDPESHLW